MTEKVTGAIVRGMDTRAIIIRRRRGFWSLALLWLLAGVMATAVGRFLPGTGEAQSPGMWGMALLMSVPSLVFVASCGLPLAPGLPARGLVGGHRARGGHGGGVAGGGTARADRDRRLRGRAQPAGLDRLVVASAPGLIHRRAGAQLHNRSFLHAVQVWTLNLFETPTSWAWLVLLSSRGRRPDRSRMHRRPCDAEDDARLVGGSHGWRTVCGHFDPRSTLP